MNKNIEDGEFYSARIDDMNANGANIRKITGVDGADKCLIGTAEMHGPEYRTVACYSLSALADVMYKTGMYDDIHEAYADAAEMFARQRDDDHIVVDD